MCEAFSQLGGDVILFLHSTKINSDACREVIKSFYGVSNEKIQTKVYLSNLNKGIELGIAVRALVHFLKDVLSLRKPKFIICRNLYAAVLFGLIVRNSIIYETHAPEHGIRKIFQGWLLSSKKVQTIVISEALKKIIKNIFPNANNIHVLHDAARAGQKRINNEERKELQQRLLGTAIEIIKFERIIGYFGHLYAGRGIDIIEGLAKKHPNYAFVIYGGNEKEIKQFKEGNHSKNLFFMGYFSPDKTPEAMSMMDVLLMPYQKTVSIGLGSIDTAKWMSPMKMFEYMSVGVPIISSDLPVLKEILVDLKNCILVKPGDIDDWSSALQRIINSTELHERLGKNAYAEYLTSHTWKGRAKKMLELLE